MSAWMQTATGGVFDFDAIGGSEIRLLDIARSLSKVCRFGGHCREHYSVAQHSVLVSRRLMEVRCPARTQLVGLLHDAAEAFVGDVVAPLKWKLGDAYAALETAVTIRIFDHFGIPFLDVEDHTWAAVKLADLEALATERRDLLPACERPWDCLENVSPWILRIEPWPHAEAVVRFLHRARELGLPLGTFS